MTKQQRILHSLEETAALLVKWESRKTFDRYQEAEKQERIAEYSRHMWKLADMLTAEA